MDLPIITPLADSFKEKNVLKLDNYEQQISRILTHELPNKSLPVTPPQGTIFLGALLAALCVNDISFCVWLRQCACAARLGPPINTAAARSLQHSPAGARASRSRQRHTMS
ncbi:unnamed protein product [Plutella xylostella]|uniref:(diamondback moth) hypothetical protein n=1 Tax=Plutella xylostella TaxID=51655 RepID=A0A8S4G5R3_PLUXY|nr:unnamed protein product [Plutella xylostella]